MTGTVTPDLDAAALEPSIAPRLGVCLLVHQELRGWQERTRDRLGDGPQPPRLEANGRCIDLLAPFLAAVDAGDRAEVEAVGAALVEAQREVAELGFVAESTPAPLTPARSDSPVLLKAQLLEWATVVLLAVAESTGRVFATFYTPGESFYCAEILTLVDALQAARKCSPLDGLPPALPGHGAAGVVVNRRSASSTVVQMPDRRYAASTKSGPPGCVNTTGEPDHKETIPPHG